VPDTYIIGICAKKYIDSVQQIKLHKQINTLLLRIGIWVHTYLQYKYGVAHVDVKTHVGHLRVNCVCESRRN